MDTHSTNPKSKFLTKPIKIVIAAVVALAVMAGGYVAVAKATDQPAFCGSACHEMGPYHEAWASGPHKGIACVECHVDPEPVAQLKHKFVALGEVYDHFKGAPTFPLSTATDVPNERCQRCHDDVVVKQVGFSHAEHAKRGPCVKCHSDAGHNVSTTALQQAGIYNVAYRHTVEPTATASVGGGKADLPGHIAVDCSACHVMSSMKCSQCHTPAKGHEKRPKDCTTCHAPGVKFVFAHPQRPDCVTCHTPPTNLKPAHTWSGACTLCHLSGPGVNWKFTHPNNDNCGICHKPAPKHKWTGACTTCHKAAPGKSFAVTHPSSTDCASCHKRPANHRSGSCTTCHHNAGASWAFSHPSSGTSCTTCHSRPAQHSSASCTTCHKNVGGSWAFSHPGSGSSCASCHNRPSKHKSGSCSTCHKNTGKSWRFSHPGSGSNCASCHSRPSKHKSGSCSTCHKSAGKSWKFSHPGSGSKCRSCHSAPGGHYGSNCQSCHRNAGKSWSFSHPGTSSGCTSCHSAPSGHYGSSCGKCHTPGTSWKNAHFSHPSIPGGEHSYKSFACSKCHPSGPPAHYCSCHGSSNGPKGDSTDMTLGDEVLRNALAPRIGHNGTSTCRIARHEEGTA